jgi:dTDP-4-dehydrorhamnose reductase
MKNHKIAVLGASGYVGQHICLTLQTKGLPCIRLSRTNTNHYEPFSLRHAFKTHGITHVINAAGLTGKPTVDALESCVTTCWQANVTLPLDIAGVCDELRIGWSHLSTGCVFSGRSPLYHADDEPDFFREGSTYVRSKIAGELSAQAFGNCHVFRIRTPFSRTAHPKNLITKLAQYDTLVDIQHSASCLEESVAAILTIIHSDAPYQIWNVVNPGTLFTRAMIGSLRKVAPAKDWNWYESQMQFLASVQAPRSFAILKNNTEEFYPMNSLSASFTNACINYRIP